MSVSCLATSFGGSCKRRHSLLFPLHRDESPAHKMTPEISIFELPHVTETIGKHLDRKDHLSCALVCKAFHREFNHFLWRELVFVCRKPLSELNIDPDRVERFRSNTQWTRKVSVDINCRKGILPLLSEVCTRLRDFTVIVSRGRHPDPEGLLLSPAIDLIARNTELRSCSFIRYASLSSNPLRKLAEALSRSPCLTELVLVFRVSPLPPGFLQCLLQNLPLTLKRLSLLWSWTRLRGDEELGSFPAQNWPQSYPCLEDAKLLVELTESEEYTICQFLERCHALREFSVPRMASTRAISNTIALLGSKRLPFALTRLDCHMWNELDGQQWRHLLLAMKDNIRSFVTSVNLNIIPSRHFIHEMTKYWSQTLEAVHIYHSHLIASSDIQLILTTCPKLRKFDCICYWMLLASQTHLHDAIQLPGLKVMASDESDDIMADWACLGLEELKLMFSDRRSSSTEEPTLSQQEEWTVRGIKRTYEQLGRLKNLRKLSIGWCSTKSYSNDANLDMSLQSGLGHMKDLTLLKEIELNFIDKVHVGVAEAQWMLDNWSSLTSISGLKRPLRMLGENVQEPDCVTLLRTKRPWLTIS